MPDFNHYDYAIGFDRISFGDRYLRMPLYAFYREYQKLENRVAPDAKELLNRGFCSFVVSNSALADPLRTSFFHKLSKYRKVDSGGRYLNNVGGPVPDKLEFCRKYKFNIAFENSVSPGYVTEKVMQPLTWFSMPIYYGDPFVEDEFSAQSMVRVRDADDVDRAIEEIIRLDKNDDEYLARVTAPCLARPYGSYEAALEKFLTDIVDRPVEEARRLNRYGCQVGRRARQLKLEEMARKLHAPVLWLRKLLG